MHSLHKVQARGRPTLALFLPAQSEIEIPIRNVIVNVAIGKMVGSDNVLKHVGLG